MKRAKPTSPLVFRIEEPLHQRLEECAARLRLKKYTLGIMAIEAAVEAIERNGYRLVVPIEFNVAHVPARVQEEGTEKTGKYPPHRTEVALAEDSAGGKPSSEKDSGRKLASDLVKKIADHVHPKGQPPK